MKKRKIFTHLKSPKILVYLFCFVAEDNICKKKSQKNFSQMPSYTFLSVWLALGPHSAVFRGHSWMNAQGQLLSTAFLTPMEYVIFFTLPSLYPDGLETEWVFGFHNTGCILTPCLLNFPGDRHLVQGEVWTKHANSKSSTCNWSLRPSN